MYTLSLDGADSGHGNDIRLPSTAVLSIVLTAKRKKTKEDLNQEKRTNKKKVTNGKVFLENCFVSFLKLKKCLVILSQDTFTRTLFKKSIQSILHKMSLFKLKMKQLWKLQFKS